MPSAFADSCNRKPKRVSAPARSVLLTAAARSLKALTATSDAIRSVVQMAQDIRWRVCAVIAPRSGMRAVPGGRRQRKGNHEDGPLALGRAHLDVATHRAHAIVDNRQPEAHTGNVCQVVAIGMRPSEPLEDGHQRLGRNADAVVADLEPTRAGLEAADDLRLATGSDRQS